MSKMQRTKEMGGGGWNPDDFRRDPLAELKVSTTHVTFEQNLKLERYAYATYNSKIKSLSDFVAMAIDSGVDIPEVPPAPQHDRKTVKFYNYPRHEEILASRPRRDFVRAAIDLIPDTYTDEIEGMMTEEKQN